MNNDTRDEVVLLNLDDIIPNRFQPREVFDERALKELAISIKEHGVIQPIIVRSINGKYEIIAGERRYKASALAGLTKIPAIIRNLDDKESSKVALLENLQRKNLNAIEEARTYQKILELDEMTQEDLAKTMGKSQSAVANKIRLLSLPDEVQDAVLKEKISERHARTLLQIPDSKKQKEFLKKIIADKMPVRRLEQEIKKEYGTEEVEGPTSIGEVVNMNQDSILIPQNSVNASPTDFINSDPLIPSASIAKEESNYGQVIIAPPEGEEAPNVPKFLNYGDIDDDEEDETDRPDLINNTFANIEDIKSNTTDINAESKTNSSDLDNLLNMMPKTSEGNDQNNNKFITPAEGIVKKDLEINPTKTSEDYFKTPDLISIDLPSEVQSKKTETVSIKELEEKYNNETIDLESKQMNLVDGKYTIQTAVEMARDLVKDLNNHDIKADIEEMNFNKSYQIIIKIDKNEER